MRHNEVSSSRNVAMLSSQQSCRESTQERLKSCGDPTPLLGRTRFFFFFLNTRFQKVTDTIPVSVEDFNEMKVTPQPCLSFCGKKVKTSFLKFSPLHCPSYYKQNKKQYLHRRRNRSQEALDSTQCKKLPALKRNKGRLR